jgi:hypothetical protein
MPSTKVKSITRRIARLEALSPSPQPKHWRGGRWRSRAPFHPSIHMRFGNLRRLPEDSRLQISGAAVSTMLKIMVDPNAPASCRLCAADRVLDYVQHGMDTEDIEVRVSDLERAADLSKSSGRFSRTEDVPTIHYDERDR